MAGTAKGYSISAIHQAPGDIWIIGTPPVDSATPQLTLATDGTPDATAHPNSICLGTTESGVDFAMKLKNVDIKADQFSAPIDQYVDEEDATIEAEVSQQSVDLLQYAYPQSTYSTASAYKQIAFGGTSIVPTFAVAAISTKRTGSNLFIVSLLFRVSSVGGVQVKASRAKKSMHKLQFKGQTDITRTAGRQIGVHYETLT